MFERNDLATDSESWPGQKLELSLRGKSVSESVCFASHLASIQRHCWRRRLRDSLSLSPGSFFPCTCSPFSASRFGLFTFLFCFRHSSLGKVNKNKALAAICRPCVAASVCESGRQHSKTSDCCQKVLHVSGLGRTCAFFAHCSSDVLLVLVNVG